MTLIIALLDNDRLIIGSDRRLTRFDSTVYDEESCKMTAFACENAKTVICYPGTAVEKNFRVEEWLLDALDEISKTKSLIHDFIYEIKDKIQVYRDKFEKIYGSKIVLEFVVAGFIYERGISVPQVWKISNLEDRVNFSVITSAACEGFFLEMAGNTSGINKQKLNDLRSLFIQNPENIHGVEMKLKHLIQNASRSSLSKNTVGQQINTCTLKSELDSYYISTYHTIVPLNTYYGLNTTFLVGGNRSISSDSQVTFGRPADPPVIVPKVSRNKLCPCGSGERYKNCHKKDKFFDILIFNRLTLSNSVESGIVFATTMYYANQRV